jgi:hypothetical protein
MAVPDLTVYNGAGTSKTFTGLGGSGVQANPSMWRIQSSIPLGFQPTAWQWGKSIKGIRQITTRVWTPYVITSADTSQQSSPAYCEIITVANFSPNVPQVTIDDANAYSYQFFVNATVVAQMKTTRPFAS